MFTEFNEEHLEKSPLRNPSLTRRVYYQCSAKRMTTAFGNFTARTGRQDVLNIQYGTIIYTKLGHRPIGGEAPTVPTSLCTYTYIHLNV
jgi:hypothetical protein